MDNQQTIPPLPYSLQIAILLSEGHTVLVHCLAGVSRSASLILAYLTKYHTRSLEKAFHLLQSIRPLVRPNIGFWWVVSLPSLPFEFSSSSIIGDSSFNSRVISVANLRPFEWLESRIKMNIIFPMYISNLKRFDLRRLNERSKIKFRKLAA